MEIQSHRLDHASNTDALEKKVPYKLSKSVYPISSEISLSVVLH